MSERFRVGLIGFGLAGSTFHAPCIAAAPALELDAVVTSNPERASRVRAEYPGTAVVDTASELFARTPDLVVVASANNSHVPLAAAALDAGSAVVVDKPFAVTSSQGAELIAHAKELGRGLTVFQNRRYDGDFKTVQALLANGSLGSVHRFESRFERWRPTLSGAWRESADPAVAGGLLFDLGSHLIDQALQLLGPAEQVYAEVDVVRPGAQVDDDVFVAIRHQGGTHSHLWMTAVAADLGPRFRVLGDHGAFVKYGLDPQEAALRAGQRSPAPDWGTEPESDWGRLGAGETTQVVRTLPGDYPAFYAGVAEALAGRAEMPVDPADALAALHVIEAARRSANEHRVVVVSDARQGGSFSN